MTDPTCSRCGGHRHLYQHACPLHLHGEADWWKGSCCMCETDIPSGADREADRFGNLYCSTACLETGQDMLLLIIRDQRDRIQVDQEATA